MLPLTGLTVVSLEQAIAAPFASRQLAELGARVIKIERPGSGDFARDYDATVNGLSSHFVWTNRSKESLTLDLKQEKAQQILHQLLGQADVFLQNLAPGAADRLGFGHTILRKRYPRLVLCSISGYGPDGPYRDKKAYDLLVQCETGLVSITGIPESSAKTGISVADIAAGMYAFSGILAALLQRSTTGEGTVIDVSLFDALAEWMGYPMYYAANGTPPPRTGAAHATIVPYGPFKIGDGHEVHLAIQNEREWLRFCADVIQQPQIAIDPHFITNPVRLEYRKELQQIIEAAFQNLTVTEVIARLDAAQIANARLNTMQEFWDHPQLAARHRWRTVNSPVGPIRALLPPIVFPDTEPRMDPIPAVGEHTDTILLSLGHTPDEIARMRDEHVI